MFGRRGLIIGAWPLALALNFPCPAEEGTKSVQLTYSSLPPSYSERGADGTLGPPEGRVAFGETIAEQHSIAAKVDGKQVPCPIKWQDVAYQLNANGQREGRLLIYGLAGCPFDIDGELEVVQSVEMRGEERIEIRAATDNILWVAATSTRPLARVGDQLVTGCEMLRNIVWVFQDKGIEFTTKSTRYVSEKSNATVRFTKDVVVMDGVKKAVYKPTK